MKQFKVIRPNDDINKIKDLIKNNPRSVSMSFSEGTRFDMAALNTPSVILIESGCISLYRKIDKKIILQFEPPFPFGITESMSSATNYYLVCETNSHITLLDKSAYYLSLKDMDAWMSMLRILTYLIDVAEEHQRMSILLNNTYDIVRYCINEIWSLPQEKRELVSVYDFIMSRHHMSRSSITKIIKSLNEGNYIVTKRGILKSLRFLPQKY